MAKTLQTFNIIRASDGYLVTLEFDDGETAEFTTDYDQLELFSEEIENHLNAGEDEQELVEDDTPEELEEED